MKTYWHRRANISIGTVTTLEPGSDATASVTEDNVLSLGIPEGEKGDQGDPGPAMTYDDMTAEDKAALAGDVVADLPYAGTSTAGVVKVGTGLAIDASGVLTWNGGSDTPQMSGAGADHNGSAGTVPAPIIGDQVKFLRGDATWANTPYPGEATTGAAGLLSASDKTKLNGIASNATYTYKNNLYNTASPTAKSAFTTDVGGDIGSYDFILIQFRCRLDYDQEKIAIFWPGGTANNYRIKKGCLQYCGFSSNKNGSRSFSASYNYSSNVTTFSFETGYFDGSANTSVCIPTAIWGLNL